MDSLIREYFHDIMPRYKKKREKKRENRKKENHRARKRAKLINMHSGCSGTGTLHVCEIGSPKL